MFTLKRGDQFTVPVVISRNGTPINITDCTVFFIVRTTDKPTSTTDTDDTVEITKDVTVHADAVNGATTIVLTSSDTDIPPGDYYRELQIKFSNGDIKSASTGIFTVLSDLNKRTTVWP